MWFTSRQNLPLTKIVDAGCELDEELTNFDCAIVNAQKFVKQKNEAEKEKAKKRREVRERKAAEKGKPPLRKRNEETEVRMNCCNTHSNV